MDVRRVTVCSPFAHIGEQGKNRGSWPGGGVGVASAAGAAAARATATPAKSAARTRMDRWMRFMTVSFEADSSWSGGVV
jgi:hypothetical protein